MKKYHLYAHTDHKDRRVRVYLGPYRAKNGKAAIRAAKQEYPDHFDFDALFKKEKKRHA